MTSPTKDPKEVDPIRDATFASLRRIVDQLIPLMFDTGVTVQELIYLIKDRAVRTATDRVCRDIGRKSNSRVAILSGLSRSEVQKILSIPDAIRSPQKAEGAARRVLAGWFDDPRFLAPNGTPEVLSIFGRHKSFERLVQVYAKGVPARAMLDELVQIDAVECCDGQLVKAKSRVPILTGLTPNAVAAIGERCGDLLHTLMHNLRGPSTPLFEATTQAIEVGVDALPFLRRELAAQGESLVSAANALIKGAILKPQGKLVQHNQKCKLGVCVYYFEHAPPSEDAAVALVSRHRKNLRRQPGRSKTTRSQSRR